MDKYEERIKLYIFIYIYIYAHRYIYLRVGVALWPLAAHLGEGKLLLKTIAVLWNYPLVENISVDNLEEKSGMEPLKAV